MDESSPPGHPWTTAISSLTTCSPLPLWTPSAQSPYWFLRPWSQISLHLSLSTRSPIISLLWCCHHTRHQAFLEKHMSASVFFQPIALQWFPVTQRAIKTPYVAYEDPASPHLPNRPNSRFSNPHTLCPMNAVPNQSQNMSCFLPHLCFCPGCSHYLEIPCPPILSFVEKS